MEPLDACSSFLFRDLISSCKVGQVSHLAKSIQLLSYLGEFFLGNSIVGFTIFSLTS